MQNAYMCKRREWCADRVCLRVQRGSFSLLNWREHVSVSWKHHGKKFEGTASPREDLGMVVLVLDLQTWKSGSHPGGVAHTAKLGRN